MSDTPETDAAWDGEDFGKEFDVKIQAFCCKLERQRNAYAETLREIMWTEPDWCSIADRHPELATP